MERNGTKIPTASHLDPQERARLRAERANRRANERDQERRENVERRGRK